jgi:hypothetical protein
MRTSLIVMLLVGSTFVAPSVDAQEYYVRQHLVGMGKSDGAGTWETKTTPSGSCFPSGSDMVKATTTTVSCAGGSCDPATRPSDAPGTTSCRAVCDGAVQPKTNGKVVTTGGRSTYEMYLGSLGAPFWDASKAVSCIAKAKDQKQRLFGCTVSRTTGASNAWIGDFSITAGATVANANLDYVACHYE